MKKKILQTIGNSIIEKLRTAKDIKAAKFYYEFGLWFDVTCINYFDIYLD